MSLVQEKTGHVRVPVKSAGFGRNGSQARTLPIASLKSGHCGNFANTGPPAGYAGTPRVVEHWDGPFGFAKISS
jgi:hypothetical protein